ncbi:DUF4376 domain-containing protein [Sphingomonadales bacterium 56]|uniref:DUF4376 domain-containing protein n=1 Tax=unclassified Sphingobium TaxID=2611147 RepID=UPI00191B30D7|nr:MULTISPECIES: DUF4376 domain-containing protein [unclassified Sphingobium]MBY2927836.1 DUF4376 domain-containing protein [Sphingomonadales bacterium 56]MBY2957936.1 DUF4376 domain-containing protein [Sphingomonadales bacterium 58]CAD7336034.1 hypothetical protein SPHS6_00808 [Sphingobium sp. S6]CAD7336097.1 hypothetical protein SPHS8_00848 [Sphingobium sp. S8]
MDFPSTPYSILSEVTAPNGAALTFHSIMAIEVDKAGGPVMLINSYRDPTSKAIHWQDRYPIPTGAIFDPADPMQAAASALVAEGGPFAGGTVLTPAQTELQVSSAVTSMLIKAARDRAQNAGQYVDGIGFFDSGPDSQRLIAGAAMAAFVQGEDFSVDWRLADNSIATLNAAQMIAVGMAIVARVDACQRRKNDLDAMVMAASTLADLAVIPVDEEWPAVGGPEAAEEIQA